MMKDKQIKPSNLSILLRLGLIAILMYFFFSGDIFRGVSDGVAICRTLILISMIRVVSDIVCTICGSQTK